MIYKMPIIFPYLILVLQVVPGFLQKRLEILIIVQKKLPSLETVILTLGRVKQ